MIIMTAVDIAEKHAATAFCSYRTTGGSISACFLPAVYKLAS
jgi:hypothetical protein